MEIKGKVHDIGAEQKVSESFKKRDLVVEYAENPQYPEYIKFEATQDKTSILDTVAIGDVVDVSFNLRGRAWVNPKGETIYFNTLNVWRVNKATDAPVAAAPIAVAPVVEPQLAPKIDITTAPDADDLPF